MRNVGVSLVMPFWGRVPSVLGTLKLELFCGIWRITGISVDNQSISWLCQISESTFVKICV